MTISIERWGKDHWSTFGYLETVCVDYGGRVDLRRMRTHPGRHPQCVAYKPMSGEPQDGSGFPTMLKDGQEQPDHDDWDCVDDIIAHGLIEEVGTGLTPMVKLTDAGNKMAGRLRTHKASGGMFATFDPAGGAV